LISVVNADHGVLVFACHIIGLVNLAIQYYRRCTEKPFLLDRHSPFGLAVEL